VQVCLVHQMLLLGSERANLSVKRNGLIVCSSESVYKGDEKN